MTQLDYRGGALHVEDVALSTIADAVSTPVYVYSANGIRNAARQFANALRDVRQKQLTFAVKANPALAVLRLLRDEEFGADIVSGGELEAALHAGMPAASVVYSGVGKTPAEMIAALDAGIGHFGATLCRHYAIAGNRSRIATPLGIVGVPR